MGNKYVWVAIKQYDYKTFKDYYCDKKKKIPNCNLWHCRSRKIIWSHDWCDTHFLEDVDLAEYDGNEEGYSNIDLILTFGFGASLGILGLMYKRRKEGESHLVEISKI